MARKKVSEVVTEAAEVHEGELLPAGDTAQMETLQTLRAEQERRALMRAHYGVDLQGADLPYDTERVIAEAQFYVAQAALSVLELGKRLILLKENTQHGEFGLALARIGISPRSAQTYMAATIKICAPGREVLQQLDRPKLLELVAEADETLDALASGGAVAGLTLDDIETMSPSELRRALREDRKRRREEQEATDRLLQDKNKRIDDLARELDRRAQLPADEQLAELSQLLAVETQKTCAAIATGMKSVLIPILERPREQLPDHVLVECDQAVRRIAIALAQLCFEHTLTTPHDVLTPDFQPEA